MLSEPKRAKNLEQGLHLVNWKSRRTCGALGVAFPAQKMSCLGSWWEGEDQRDGTKAWMPEGFSGWITY